MEFNTLTTTLTNFVAAFQGGYARLQPAINGLLGALALTGCAKQGPQALIGTLEWDRIAVTAELAEPVLRWAVAEGDKVEAGAVLLELDPRRQDTRIAEARGNLAMNEGKLAELTHGARIEPIDAARANLASAHAAETDAEAEYTRVAAMRKRELVAQSQLDGKWKPDNVWGGIKDGMIKMAPFNKVVPQATQDLVNKTAADIGAGKFHPFTGPLKDNDGKERLAAGQVMDDATLSKMDYYVEGVQGKLPTSK